MKILAIIPARGGSKGVLRKNIRALAGKPLIAYTIEAALASNTIDRIVVSTDEEEISSISRALGVEVLMRPKHLAEDGATTLSVLQHVVRELREQGYSADAVLTLQPTSPLRTAGHIDEAITLFASEPEADSLVSCVEVPHIYHPLSVMKKDQDGHLVPYSEGHMPTRRQDKGQVFARNGAAIYITRTSCLDHFVFGGTLIAYMMDGYSSVDVDTLEDFATVERLLLGHQVS